jgi:predicted kinase
VALVLAPPATVVLARNASRARRVNEKVVRYQLERVERTAADGILTGEGCAAVWVFREPEAIDAVTVARLPPTGEQGEPGVSRSQPPRLR